MPETTLSYQQVQELLQKQQEMFLSALKDLKKMNPLEQKKFDEEMEAERRKLMMIKMLGEIEEKAQRDKMDACSHMRYPAGHRRAGWGAPKGTLGAEWTTGGQVYQNGLAMTICMRCNSTWLWKPSQEYYASILQNGLLDTSPPAPEEVICAGCFHLKIKCKCNELLLGKTA